jgi:hypothetical protein
MKHSDLGQNDGVQLVSDFAPFSTIPYRAKEKCLQNQNNKKPLIYQGLIGFKLVAGAGFEPAAFRL